METYIIRIYRRGRNISDSLVGYVEEVGVDRRKPFHNIDQLCDILRAGAGETVLGRKRKKAKSEERRMYQEGIHLDRQSGIDCKI